MFYHYLAEISFPHLLVEIPGEKRRNWVTIADNFVNTGTGCYWNTNKGQCSGTVSWLKQLVVGLLSGGPGFISGQFMFKLSWTEFSQITLIPMSVSRHQCSIFIFLLCTTDATKF